MKRILLILLIVGACLLVIGGGAFAIAMAKVNWDISKFANVTYEEKNFEADAETVSEINLNAETENISFILSEDDKIHVTYFNRFDRKGQPIKTFEPSVKDGKLSIAETKAEKSVFNMDFGKEKTFVIAIPQGKKTSTSLCVGTGDIAVGAAEKAMTFESLSIQTSTGDIRLIGTISSDTNVTLKATTGDILIEANLSVAKNLSCTVTTGLIKADQAVTAEKITCETSTGKIKLNAAITANEITCATDTGDVLTKAPITAALIHVTTDTGDVEILLAGTKDEYSCLLSTNTGEISPQSYLSGNKQVKVATDTGDIKITFQK